MIKLQKHRFGTRSRTKIATCHDDLQLIHNTAIKHCPLDYGVHEGSRTFEKQLEYFLSGASGIDPRNNNQRAKAMHLHNPSKATDMHVSEKHKGNSLIWDRQHLTFLAAYLMGVAGALYEAGEISHLLRWGGNWDNDGVILLDQSFDDLPHVELYIPK